MSLTEDSLAGEEGRVQPTSVAHSPLVVCILGVQDRNEKSRIEKRSYERPCPSMRSEFDERSAGRRRCPRNAQIHQGHEPSWASPSGTAVARLVSSPRSTTSCRAVSGDTPSLFGELLNGPLLLRRDLNGDRNTVRRGRPGHLEVGGLGQEWPPYTAERNAPPPHHPRSFAVASSHS